MESERRLMSLINSVRVLNSTRDLSAVLHQLIKEVLNVIEGSNASVLFLYDKKKNELYAKSSIGFDMDYLKEIRMKPGQGMSGKTFSAKEGIMFTSPKDTYLGMENLTTEVKDLYASSLGSMEYPMSAICVPLMSYNECIGVLTVDIYEQDIQFTETDLQLLETFAAQATIAIENATLFSQNVRTQKIHEELSKVFLSKKGLEDITKTLASLIDKHVFIFNELVEFLTASDDKATRFSKILRERNNKFLNEAITKGEVSNKDLKVDNQTLKIYFFPIKNEKLRLGLLTIVLEGENSDLDPLDRFAVEQAVNIFAMEIDRQEKLLAEDLSYSGALLEQLISGGYDVLPSDHAVKINFPERRYHNYVIAELLIENPLFTYEKINERKAQLNRLIYREIARQPYKTVVHNQNYKLTILFTVPSNEREGEVIKKLTDLFNNINGTSVKYYELDHFTGIGKVVENLNDVPQSYKEAQQCIQSIRSSDTMQRVLGYSQLGINRLFLNTDLRELKEYVNETLGSVIEYDTKHDSQLLTTLEVYLNANQNMSVSSRKLFVHVNTIKYRLKTIKELLNIKNINGKSVFELQLALHLLNTFNNK
ncbi:helix-turn-helix domain-containing protein [Halobacillus massiliensis]|uniref:helix-turn-helix domain-containing protein n=1 Tax=Halobacillus massiliensis TaxID=1926286 RepID=UPI0009E50F3A|nr:helix-turn-helix domain-containing protein [Halobacillus massiliensis]